MMSEERNEGSLRRLVRPAFMLMLAMGQFGPNYEPEGWPRVIDCLLRAAVAFPLVLWALHDLKSNSALCATQPEQRKERT